MDVQLLRQLADDLNSEEQLLGSIAEGERSIEAAICDSAAAEIERLRAEATEWRECAQYDAMMEGPKFKGWNRSALDRCRKKYIESDHEQKAPND